MTAFDLNQWKRCLIAAVEQGRISLSQYAVLDVMAVTYADYTHGGDIRPSLDTLAKKCGGIHPDTAKTARQAGVKAGLLVEVRRGGGAGDARRASLYRLTIPHSGSVDPECGPESAHSGSNSGPNSGWNSGSVLTPTSLDPSDLSRPAAAVTYSGTEQQQESEYKNDVKAKAAHTPPREGSLTALPGGADDGVVNNWGQPTGGWARARSAS